MNIIQIDKNACSGCKNCYKACPYDVIRWDEEQSQPIVAYPEDCVRCNACELVCCCPTHCIKVIPDFNMFWPSAIQ